MEQELVKSLQKWRMNKAEIEKTATYMEREIIHNPIGVACNIAVLSNFIAVIKNMLTVHVMMKFKESGMNTVHLGEFSITKSSTSSHDYSNSTYWKELNEEKKRIEKLMKAIEKPVNDSKSKRRIYPAVKVPGKSFFKVTIPDE